MSALSEILAAYREGDRGLPNYEELIAIADQHDEQECMIDSMSNTLTLIDKMIDATASLVQFKAQA